MAIAGVTTASRMSALLAAVFSRLAALHRRCRCENVYLTQDWSIFESLVWRSRPATSTSACMRPRSWEEYADLIVNISAMQFFEVSSVLEGKLPDADVTQAADLYVSA